MANIAYIRLPEGESLSEAKKAFKEVSIDKYFVDSGNDRANRDQMIDYARDTDTVIVRSLLEFANSLSELFSLLETMKSKEVGFRSIEEPAIDSTVTDGCGLYEITTALNDFKKNSLRLRQNEGRKVAIEKGLYKGREKKPINRNEFVSLYNKWQSKQITKDEMCQKLNISLATLDRRISEYRKESKKSNSTSHSRS